MSGGEAVTISEVSKKFDIPQDTLRYYDKVRLVFG
ncbi:MerR family DNA-binding transcriptional regulator [Sporomusa acidovorans]